MSDNQNKISSLKKYGYYYLFILFELVVIILYGLFTDYGELGNPDMVNHQVESAEHITRFYAFFQDVHVMIFIGFGFLMTFLKSYSWSAVGFNYLLAAWVLQISILMLGFWTRVFNGNWKVISIEIKSLIEADFTAGTFLISFGAVLGKLNFIQLFIMSTIETIFITLITIIGYNYLLAVDIGGSMFIHCFGAYFGLSVAFVINSRSRGHYENPKCSANYNSNLFSMVGTIFLWMFWPSFNGATGFGHAQLRSVVNTYLSLTGSVFMVFILNPFFKDGKFHMEDVLNASLAGGVMIGASADLIIYPWVSLLIGCFAGTISIIGFEKLSPVLARKINLHDTCGVNNLHGMPGFFGGLIAIIIAATATKENYGSSLTILFPRLDIDRTASQQAGYQVSALFLVFGSAIISGLITGIILRSACFIDSKPYEDEDCWFMEEEENHLTLPVKTETNNYDKIGYKVDDNNIPTDNKANKEMELNTVE